MSQRERDETERPIAYYSRTLSATEQRYSQLDKEALAIVAGVKKFHQYLAGRRFEINTDHKPLIYIFDQHRGISPLASGRIQRWSLILAGYDYTVRHRPGKEIPNADALSRLPLSETLLVTPIPAELIQLVEHLNSTPVTVSEIKYYTNKDPVLSRVTSLVSHGWPNDMDAEEFIPYSRRKDELSMMDGCVLWGARVVIPLNLQDQVIDELHQNHPGIVRMKALARSYLWWPKIDEDIERKVKSCEICQSTRYLPARAPLHPWDWPTRPWSRLHLDYAGPFWGRMFLIVIDSHSKWLEVLPVRAATSEETIEKLGRLFSTFGIPDKIVSDNGSVFTSGEFEAFLKNNGIVHIRVSPYHPSSNGLAERAVQIFKKAIERQREGTIETKLSRLLFSYRTTPQSTTTISPAEMLFGRKLKTRLDLLHPDLQSKVKSNIARQKEAHDRNTKLRQMEIGNRVYVRSFKKGPYWVEGEIYKELGPLSYLVKLTNGNILKRHVDHLRLCTTNPPSEEKESDNIFDNCSFNTVENEQQLNSEPTVRKSQRIRKPPDRYY